jgi:D-xylose transport system permease protein
MPEDSVADVADATQAPEPQASEVQARRPGIGGLLAQTEIDLRLFGMVAALAIILIGFHVISGGTFLRPVNMVTLAVQAAGIAVIATGMVLVIVSRNIDLSVGSLVGFVAMVYAQLMAQWLAAIGIGPDAPFRWALVLAIGIAVGAGFGAFQGFIIAYVGVPSFVVTLGGLLAIRGAIWYLSNGAAVTGIDPTFQLLGGTSEGSIGGPLTWAVGIIGSLAIIALLYNNRRRRRQYGFPLRPMWAEVALGAAACVAILGLAAYANANKWPQGLADRIAAAQGLPPGQIIDTGFPNPVMIVLGVTLVVTWLATRRRFGRYVYAYGGNPDAAALAGINTRFTILKTYVLMGVLCAIAVARLTAATLDIGQSYELYVIAAAVVGGTSFAGGVGTVAGAVLGAFVMQSLAYGLSYIGVPSPGQNVAAGIVLILAVGLDAWNRRRGTGTVR